MQCPHCGCTSFHYSSRARCRVCDQCGHPVHDQQQEQQLMLRDRTYDQAMANFEAGHWDKAIALLKPLTEQYPTERKLYLAILRASTKDFADIDMADATNRATASAAWETLVRLNGVSADMLQYSARRRALRVEELERRKRKIVKELFGAAFFSILAAISFSLNDYFAPIFYLGGSLCFLISIRRKQPTKVVKALRAAPDLKENPFAGGDENI